MSKNEEEAVEKAPEQTEEGDSRANGECHAFVENKKRVVILAFSLPPQGLGWLLMHP